MKLSEKMASLFYAKIYKKSIKKTFSTKFDVQLAQNSIAESVKKEYNMTKYSCTQLTGKEV